MNWDTSQALLPTRRSVPPCGWARAGVSAVAITDHIYSKVNNPLTFMSDVFKVRPTSIDSFFRDGGLRIGEVNLERILATFLPNAIRIHLPTFASRSKSPQPIIMANAHLFYCVQHEFSLRCAMSGVCRLRGSS